MPTGKARLFDFNTGLFRHVPPIKTRPDVTPPPAPTAPSSAKGLNDTNTGVLGAGLAYSDLTPVVGNVKITLNGAVYEAKVGSTIVATSAATGWIERLDISGGYLDVLCNNAQIRRVRVQSASTTYPLLVRDGYTGTVVEYSRFHKEIGSTAAVDVRNTTIRFCNLSGGADSLKIRSGLVLEDTWLHDMIKVVGGHHDVMQTAATSASGELVSGIRIRRCKIDQTAIETTEGNFSRAIIISSNDCTTDDWIVEDNFITGGAPNSDISLQLGGGGTFPVTNTIWRRNRWGINASAVGEVGCVARGSWPGGATNVWENTNVMDSDGRLAVP